MSIIFFGTAYLRTEINQTACPFKKIATASNSMQCIFRIAFYIWTLYAGMNSAEFKFVIQLWFVKSNSDIDDRI